MSMPIIQEKEEPTYDNLYLATVVDKALDYSNPNYNPAEGGGEEKKGCGHTEDTPSSQTEVMPSNTTMDGSLTTPSGAVKTTLLGALEAVETMDEEVETPTDKDEETHQNWEKEQRSRMMPNIPNSLGGDEHVDDNGLVYLEYTFTVDPSKYKSSNYMPINNTEGNDTQNRGKVTEESQGEHNEEIEVSVDEKTAADAYPDKAVLDYASFIDGSSFICFDEWKSVDYSKIAMDAGAKKAPTRTTCKTTFSQCRAENPLFCRFHGPKLLEKDIKTNIVASLGKGCVVSVTKDKGQKNPLTFRLTIGCPPAKKKMVQDYIHKFFSFTPGLSLKEDYKDVGGDKMSTEFDMDILKADQPPKKTESKAQAAQWETEKAKAAGKKMAVVGETPPKVEKLANEGGVPKTDMQQPPVEEEVEEKIEEKVEQPVSTTSNSKEDSEVPSTKGGHYTINEEVENYEKQKEFSDLVDKAINEGYFKNEQFQNEYDGIVADVGEDAASMEQKTEALKALMEKYKPTEEEKDKKSYEDEFNAALMEYPEGGGGSDNDAKKIEINEAFTKAFIGNDAEGMKSAIGAMKELVSDVKGKEGNKKGEGEVKKEDLSSANAPSGFHFVDDAAMKMTGEIDDLAHQNSELMSSNDNVSALYYGAQLAISGLDFYKQGLEEITAKIKKYNEVADTAFDALTLISLTKAQADQQAEYDAAKANAELSVKDFQEAVEKAKAHEVDSMKGTAADMVESIVRTTASAIFPNGKPDGVDSVEEMIDALDEDMTSHINNLLMVNGKVSYEDLSKVHSIEDKHSFGEKYKAVSSASKELESAITSFKDLIDGVKSKEGAESLKKAADGISEYSQKLKDAFAAYKMAVARIKKEVSDLAEIKKKEKKLSKDSGNDQPSQDEILDAAKKHAVDMASSDVDGSTKYYAEQIGNVISGDGFPKNVDKELPSIGSRRNLAKHYLHILKDLDGVPPSVIAALQKVVDMPKWGEKKEKKQLSQDTQGNWSGLGSKFIKPTSAKQYGTMNKGNIPYEDNPKFIDAMKKSGVMKSDELGNNIISFEVDNNGTTTIHLGTTHGDHQKTDKLVEYLEKAGFKGIEMNYEKQSGSPEMPHLIIPKQQGQAQDETPVPVNIPKGEATASADPKDAIKAKIAAMSVKEKMEKSIPLLEKKIKAEPNNEKWQKMLKQAKAYLAAHSSKDDDYLE